MKITRAFQDINFEWDNKKAVSNLTKHSVSFESACEAFFDPFFVLTDAGIAEGEQREAVIGMTIGWRLLFVVHVVVDDVVRIISARAATEHERKHYEDQ
ncbi:MAG TPA: BrnT family toxin [Pyrinomonadaceae bacterium]|nr:BrnT family toxin [Pyrinomonadaceae bacterium]